MTRASRSSLILATLCAVAAIDGRFAGELHAQPSNGASRTVSPAATAAGFHAERLSRLDQWVQESVDSKRIPGAVVMLVRNGKIEHHKAFGMRDMESKAPLRTDDIFRIASQTKAITSLAVMMLWEEGKIGLDDPVGRYIPSFRTQTVLSKFNPADSSYESKPTSRRITVRQLLTHTSGLDYAEIGSEQFQAIYAKAGLTALGREGALLATDIDKLGKLPLVHEPGARWTYSLSTDVLGRLVEVVSGMPLDQFMRTRIFQPLKMNDTWFELPADKRSRLVTLYEDSSGTLVRSRGALGLTADFPARKVTYFSGGGGLASTTADYARFLQMFLNGGELDGVRIIGRKTVELMLTNQTAGIPGIPFGLGFALETPENDHRSPLTLGSFSWSGAFATYYWGDPQERLVGLIFTNVLGNTAPMDARFKTFVYSALQ